MTAVAPRLYIAVPPATVPHPFGLLSVAVPRDPADPHWQNGVEFEPYRCDAAELYALPTCEQYASDSSPAKDYAEGVPLADAFPFAVYGSFKCSPVGNWDRAEDRARHHLHTGRERAIETAIETGAAGASPALNGASTTDVTPTPGTAVGIVSGVGLLESWIAANTTGGVIHLSPLLATLALAEHLLVEDGAVLRTKLRTPVIVGAGYTGTHGPNNDSPDPGDYWAFASGIPQVWISDELVVAPRAEALDTATNDLEILVEQTVLVGWACGAAGVLVTV